jgi:DNA-binding MarR family transcriptional regulator
VSTQAQKAAVLPNVKLPASRRLRAGKAANAADRDLEPHLSLMDDVDYDVLPKQLGFWIRRAQLAVMSSYERHMADLDLRPVETAAILLIGQNKDISQIVLGSALGTDQSTMVAICTRLEKRGYVERRRLPEDRRYQLLNLTASGRKAAVAIRRRLTAHNENLLDRFSATERKQVLSLLQLLIRDR